MAYHHKITKEVIREKLGLRIAEAEAELEALKGVKINTDHKVLTNRAISGKGARIGDYIGIGKALYVSYTVDHSKYGGSPMKYMSRDITAYSYYDENGAELGSKECLRISRTITPAELAVIVQDVKDGLASAIGDLKSEYRRADSIARKQNALVDKIDEFNKSVSYASDAQI